MNRPPHRPLSVWITQLILAPPLLILGIALTVSMFQCFLSKQLQCLSSSSLSSFATGLLTFALIGLIFWGLQTRKRYGQWLAAIVLMSSMVMSIAESHHFQLIYRSIAHWQPLPTPPYECWKGDEMLTNARQSCGYSSYLELALTSALEGLLSLFLGFLSIRLLCSHAAKRFFH